MTSKLHALAALAVAVALHLAAFAWRPPEAGAVSSGAGGEALVSLEASSGSIAEMVEEWERPPEPASEPPPQVPPQLAQPEPPPQMAAPDLPVTPVPAPAAPMALPEAPDMPDMEVAELPPPPPPEPEPEPAPEPEPEPEPLPDTRPPPRPEPQPEPQRQEQPRSEPQPQRQPAPPPAENRAGQRAAGSGGGANAGERGTAESATEARARTNDLVAGWGGTVRARVERRVSAVRNARGASIEVRIYVSPAGRLLQVALTRSSGDPSVDAAVLQAVKGVRLPKAPAGLTEASYQFDLPMTFLP